VSSSRCGDLSRGVVAARPCAVIAASRHGRLVGRTVGALCSRGMLLAHGDGAERGKGRFGRTRRQTAGLLIAMPRLAALTTPAVTGAARFVGILAFGEEHSASHGLRDLSPSRLRSLSPRCLVEPTPRELIHAPPASRRALPADRPIHFCVAQNLSQRPATRFLRRAGLRPGQICRPMDAVLGCRHRADHRLRCTGE
jgi:hypothetical protein